MIDDSLSRIYRLTHTFYKSNLQLKIKLLTGHINTKCLYQGEICIIILLKN